MAVKPADQMATQLDEFIANLRAELPKMEAFRDRLAGDPAFQELWSSDSGQAMRDAGFDPEARTQLGFPPYERGPECNWCMTPMGNLCHC
ncbi:MAG: hypothetical protein M3Y09_18495 [Actinomycetota bacterium]|nr:hypothetical protein [Actinomycetota bacterium]